MTDKSADKGMKTVKTVTLAVAVATGVGFLVRYFYKKYLHDWTEDSAMSATKNAASYASELYLALAKGKWFTAADKGKVIAIYNQIPDQKMLNEVEKRYKIQAGNTLNEDLKKTFSIQEYSILQNIVKENEAKAQSGKRKLFPSKKNTTQSPPQRTVAFNAEDLAKSLYKAAQGKDINKVLDILRLIFTKAEYQQVNYHYKNIPSWYETSRTIVTDLLDYAFKESPAFKDQIKKEFIRMGLKVNPVTGTWSLDGIRMN